MARFGQRLPVELKHDDTPVTEVDLAVERAIRAVVTAERPGDGVLGEEGGLDASTDRRVWIVDPVDGTKLFAAGIPLWTTLIGLRVDGEVVVGVADAPALGERYHATRGGGAWRDGRRLRVSDVQRLGEGLVLHSGLEEWTADGRDQALRRIARRAGCMRGLSDGWAQLLVARGSAEALLEHEPCFEWDFAATALIVEEAGGRLSTFDGSPPAPGRELLVSNGLVHEEALALLAAAEPSARAGAGSGPHPARSRTS